MRIGFPGTEFDAGARERRTFLDADPEIPLVFTDFLFFIAAELLRTVEVLVGEQSSPASRHRFLFSDTIFTFPIDNDKSICYNKFIL